MPLASGISVDKSPLPRAFTFDKQTLSVFENVDAIIDAAIQANTIISISRNTVFIYFSRIAAAKSQNGASTIILQPFSIGEYPQIT